MAKTQASGTVLKQGATVIAHITSINPGGAEKSEVDTTDFASVANESLPGLIDYGEAAIAGYFGYADAGQTILRADADDAAATVKSWTIEFTKQAAKVTFNGWVRRYIPVAGAPNEAYTFDASIRRTGVGVWAAL